MTKAPNDSFAPLRALFAKSYRTVADLDTGLEKVDTIERDALVARATAAKARDDVTADDATRTKARAAAEAAARDLADIGIWRAKIGGEREAAVADEENTRRRKIYDAAAASLGKPDALKLAYEKAARETLATVRAMAEMSLVATEANARLPAGAEPLPDPFADFTLASRGFIRPGLPRETVCERPVTMWCFVDTWTPVSLQKSVQVSSRDGRRGYVSPNTDRSERTVAVAGNIEVELRSFIEVTFLAETINEWAGPYTATNLALPGLYTPPTGAFAPSDAAGFIAAIDATLAAETAAPPNRERKVELRPVTIDGEVLEAA